MKNMKNLLAVISSAVMLSAMPAAMAEMKLSTGLINVDIRGVADIVAKRLKVEAGKIPETVQIPVHVAAEVCSIEAEVLVERAKTEEGGGCTAKIATSELNQFVRRQIEGIAR